MLELDRLDFAKGNGLVVVVAQDARTGQVLMSAFADREALERTIKTGEMHYRSRTRGLWHKGATSGNTQRVVALIADCDGDTVLARVIPSGVACHTGAVTCFGAIPAEALGALDAIVESRMSELASRAAATSSTGADSTGADSTGAPVPTLGYTAKLLGDRNLRLKKIGEESAEFVTACADGDSARATEEAADLFYHIIVALRATGGSLDGVRAELQRRNAGRDGRNGPGGVLLSPAPSSER